MLNLVGIDGITLIRRVGEVGQQVTELTSDDAQWKPQNDQPISGDEPASQLGRQEDGQKPQKYVVQKTANDKETDKSTLYYVCWYGRQSQDDTSEPAANILQRFVALHKRHTQR